jgi:hypothetical protein
MAELDDDADLGIQAHEVNAIEGGHERIDLPAPRSLLGDENCIASRLDFGVPDAPGQ